MESMRVLICGLIGFLFAGCSKDGDVVADDGDSSKAPADVWDAPDKSSSWQRIESGRFKVGEALVVVSEYEELCSIDLEWASGSVTLGFEGVLRETLCFRDFTMRGVIETLTVDSDGDADDEVRRCFFGKEVAGVVIGEEDFLVLRYREESRHIDGVIADSSSGAYGQFVGVLDAVPSKWEEVAGFLYANIVILHR